MNLTTGDDMAAIQNSEIKVHIDLSNLRLVMMFSKSIYEDIIFILITSIGFAFQITNSYKQGISV